MAGQFELFMDEEANVRFRMIGPDGAVLAVSGQYPDIRAAAAGVEAMRECAGTGLIRNLCPGAQAAERASRPTERMTGGRLNAAPTNPGQLGASQLGTMRVGITQGAAGSGGLGAESQRGHRKAQHAA